MVVYEEAKEEDPKADEEVEMRIPAGLSEGKSRF